MDDEIDDGITYKICKITWIELTEKYGHWIQYNICDEYIYSNCYDKRDIQQMMFFFFYSTCIGL